MVNIRIKLSNLNPDLISLHSVEKIFMRGYIELNYRIEEDQKVRLAALYADKAPL